MQLTSSFHQWEFNDATLSKHSIWQMFAWQRPHRQVCALFASWSILLPLEQQNRVVFSSGRRRGSRICALWLKKTVRIPYFTI
jgi:hypothetical protein